MSTLYSNSELIQDRAKQYLQKIPESISGQGGHGQLYQAAVVLVQGFSLDSETAEALLLSDYNPRCVPEWSVAEIRHKVQSALKDYRGNKPRGWLIEGQSRRYPYNSDYVANRPIQGSSEAFRAKAKNRQFTGPDTCVNTQDEAKPKPDVRFYRQDQDSGYFWRFVKESIYQGKAYWTEYYWNGYRYENQPNGRPDRNGRVLIENWIHLYDNGAGYPYLLVNRMKWNDGRKIPGLYHWEASRGRYEAGAGGLAKIPYRAVELKESTFVRIVEGEKCADCLAAFLASQGLLDVDNSVTCFGGCTSFKPELSGWFIGKHVLVYSDNDEAGRKFADKVAAGLVNVAASVRILDHWPDGFPEHGDIVDYIEINNNPDGVNI